MLTRQHLGRGVQALQAHRALQQIQQRRLVHGLACHRPPPPPAGPVVVALALRSSGGRLGRAQPGRPEQHGGGAGGRAQLPRSRGRSVARRGQRASGSRLGGGGEARRRQHFRHPGCRLRLRLGGASGAPTGVRGDRSSVPRPESQFPASRAHSVFLSEVSATARSTCPVACPPARGPGRRRARQSVASALGAAAHGRQPRGRKCQEWPVQSPGRPGRSVRAPPRRLHAP